MAEDSDLERSEAPTPRRMEQAREEGQLTRSRELTTFAVLMAGGGGLWVMGPQLVDGFAHLFKSGLSFERAAAFDPQIMLAALFNQFMSVTFTVAPLLVLLAVAALAAPLIVNGWLFTLKPIAPDWSRIDPMKGLARMFSVTSVLELGKAVAKATLITVVAGAVMWQMQSAVVSLATQSLGLAMAHLGSLLATSFFVVAGAMIIIAISDVPLSLWQQTRNLRMTKEDLRREAKETDGDPHQKARIRTAQRDAARRRMMSEVPKADVVVTNPTHYAVALVYQEGGMRAPKVVAKGAHLLAQRIRALAEEHRVPVLEAPPLARALYKHTDLGQEIPERLYVAVAQVLAYVFQLKRHKERGGPVPRGLDPLDVPADLDPESQEGKPT